MQREANLSTVLVTHDPEEAAFLADEILVLCDGVVLQSGAITDVYRHPSSLQVAQLLGVRNVGTGVIAADGTIRVSRLISITPGEALAPGTPVLWSVPPELVTFSQAAPDAQTYRALVDDVIELGATVEVVVKLAGGLTLTARSRDPTACIVGESCLVQLDRDAVSVWSAPAGGDRRVVST